MAIRGFVVSHQEPEGWWVPPLATPTIKGLVVYLHQEPEGWWAESPATPGFTAVGATKDEVEQQAQEGLRFYFGDPATPFMVLFVEPEPNAAVTYPAYIGADVFRSVAPVDQAPVSRGVTVEEQGPPGALVNRTPVSRGVKIEGQVEEQGALAPLVASGA